MITRHLLRVPALVCLGVAIMAGCSRSPRATFYTLSPVASPEAAPQTSAAPTVAVVSVTVPDLVDRPQLVVRVDAARVDILETHRWAEPLKSGIPRLLAENLSRLLGGARVSTYPQNAATEADYRVLVDFQRFESTGDAVTVDALWTIRSSAEGTPKAGRSQLREPGGGEGYGSQVSAYNRALLAVSNDIAAAIRKDWVAAR